MSVFENYAPQKLLDQKYLMYEFSQLFREPDYLCRSRHTYEKHTSLFVLLASNWIARIPDSEYGHGKPKRYRNK